MAKLHPDLVAAQKRLKTAKDAHDALVRRVQKECKHPTVLARVAGYRYLDTYYQEMRVCPHCGLMEEGHLGTFKKLKTEFVSMHGMDFDIYKHWISTEAISPVARANKAALKAS